MIKLQSWDILEMNWILKMNNLKNSHNNSSIRVVYNCAGNWDKFKDYTSALTHIRDLTIGWKHEEELYK